VAGKTKRDQIRNMKIKNQLKQESVGVLMEKRTLRWYGHAVRMESERRPKLVLEARLDGGRGKGRPTVEWEEYVEGLARKRGTKLPEERRLAQDRDEYRKCLLKSDAKQQKGMMMMMKKKKKKKGLKFCGMYVSYNKLNKKKNSGIREPLLGKETACCFFYVHFHFIL
jgi:hypothetical protein